MCACERLLQFLQLKTGECGPIAPLLSFRRKFIHFTIAILIGYGAICATGRRSSHGLCH